MATSNTHSLVSDVEAAKYLGLAPQTLRKWRHTGTPRLPYIKLGGRVRYRLSDLDKWLQDRTVCSTGEADAL